MALGESNQAELEAGLLAGDQLSNPPPKRTLIDCLGPLCALCLAIIIEGYLMLNVFSYAGFMVIKLVPDLNANNAGSYSGFLVAMFQIGRAFSSYTWGELADKIGRKNVFYLSYGLSIVFTLGFSFSTSLWMAFVTRFLLGASNALVSVVKIACTELAEGDKDLESKMMGFVFGMRGWAYFICPSIGGYLSDPVKQYPHSFLSTKFNDFFTAYPYALPNFFGVFLTLAGAYLIYRYYDEKPRISSSDENNEESNVVNMATIWAKPAIRDHLIAYWLLLVALLFFDGAIPLYLMATDGGLSLQEDQISNVLFSAGVVFGIFHYITYHKITSKFSLYKAMVITSICGVPVSIFIPFASILNRGAPEGSLSIPALLFMAIIIGSTVIFAIAYYSLSSVGSNRSVKPEELSVMNGVSMMGGSIAQGFGPIAAGYVTSFALSSGFFPPNVGVFVAFTMITIIGLVLAILTMTRLKKYYPN